MSLFATYPLIEMKRPSSVRRCLFERPTAEKQESDFSLQESRLFLQDAKAFSEKWGFDPITDSVVNGSEYECTPVDLTLESVPSFYTKGYAPRKPRPVQSLRRERSLGLSAVSTRLNFEKPTKRKLQLDDNEIFADENKLVVPTPNKALKRVPIDGESFSIITESGDSRPAPVSSSASSSLSMARADSPISLPVNFMQFDRTKGSRSASDFSPRSSDLCTPQQRQRSLTQKTIKDYLKCQKPKCSGKILPRT